eukprot:Opistho-2@32767
MGGSWAADCRAPHSRGPWSRGCHLFGRQDNASLSIPSPMPSVFLLRRCQPSLQKSHAQVQSLAGWWVCGSSEQVREAPAAIEALKPDFIACDLRLLDGHASRLGYALKHGAHQPPLLLLASTADDLQLFEALRAGGHGYAAHVLCVDT